MDLDDLQDDTMLIHIQINSKEGILDLEVGHNLSENMADDEMTFYLDVLNGLVASLKVGLEPLAYQGMLMRRLADFTGANDDDVDVDFVPDEELLDAINDSKVISFKKRIN